MTAPNDDELVATDLYAFGSRAALREPRIDGYNLKAGQEPDLVVDEHGMIRPMEPPLGASTFADPSRVPLTGHYHRLPAGVRLPKGLGVRADGIDVEGGTQLPTHHTIYPTEPMRPDQFIRLLKSLPWEYGGKKWP